MIDGVTHHAPRSCHRCRNRVCWKTRWKLRQ